MMRTFLSLALFGIMAVAASAAVITLSTPENDPAFVSYKQTTQSPCVIGDPSCKAPAGWSHTVLPANPNPPEYLEYSPDYTVGQINTLLNTLTFALGLDLNDTSDPQSLFEVSMLINGAVVQSWTDPTGFSYKSTNNGTGQSDVNFLGFSLVGYQATDTVSFYLHMENVNDGRENLFLVNTAVPPEEIVPEPGTYALIGAALVALQVLRKRN